MSRGFIILATQRTGSSWVQEMLNSHPQLKVYNELFLRDATGVSIWEPRDMEFANTYLARHPRGPGDLMRDYWTVRYVRRVFNQPGRYAIGFKYMYDQVSHSRAVMPFAALARVSVVHLTRNLLDVVISSKLALSNGMYHFATDGRPPIPWHRSTPRPDQLELDPDEIFAELSRLSRECQRFRRWLRMTRTRTCEVAYEELVAGPSAFGRILAFLGLPAEDATRLSSGLRKIRAAPQSETIRNFADIERRLVGTAFEPLLESDGLAASMPSAGPVA